MNSPTTCEPLISYVLIVISPPFFGESIVGSSNDWREGLGSPVPASRLTAGARRSPDDAPFTGPLRGHPRREPSTRVRNGSCMLPLVAVSLKYAPLQPLFGARSMSAGHVRIAIPWRALRPLTAAPLGLGRPLGGPAHGA